MPRTLVGSGGWYYLRAARRSLKRVANDTVELPLSPPNADPWTTANAFPGHSFAEPVLLLPAPNDPRRLFVLERRGTIVSLVPRLCLGTHCLAGSACRCGANDVG